MKKCRPYVDYCRQRFSEEDGQEYSYHEAEEKVDEFYAQEAKQRVVQIQGERQFQEILSGRYVTKTK